MLLLASAAVFESEVREALDRQHRLGGCSTCFEVVYLDLTSVIDCSRSWICHQARHYSTCSYLVSLSPLRPSGPTPPLRSRSAPLGLSSATPAEDEKVALPTLFRRYWPGAPSKRYTKPLVRTLRFLKSVEALWTDLPRSGCYVNFNSCRAVVMLAVLLSTYARSREQIKSVL